MGVIRLLPRLEQDKVEQDSFNSDGCYTPGITQVIDSTSRNESFYLRTFSFRANRQHIDLVWRLAIFGRNLIYLIFNRLYFICDKECIYLLGNPFQHSKFDTILLC